ncbi:unnamed protein product [Acanthoscelides obtectus]|uniref:Uncharacterized protein n=1 Tax=Acanthoscelides obtectus TaxID=200917 RepID=A0A9P0JNM2_ACAOB|nr:unnamed protein product [Acanthoscelides obtectus]CAK1634626.1 hypothetical protein AOBTE_LOCUS8840 [Acanthoscelides obtectus]
MCREMCGRNWELYSRMSMRLYRRVVRPMITYGSSDIGAVLDRNLLLVCYKSMKWMSGRCWKMKTCMQHVLQEDASKDQRKCVACYVKISTEEGRKAAQKK